MTQTLVKSESDIDAESFIRSLIADRAGGATFDEGGSYVFTEMLNSERELQKKAVLGDKSSTVLAFSVADPTLKVVEENFMAGVKYYSRDPDATRYTDLNGVRNFRIDDEEYENTQQAIADIFNRKYESSEGYEPVTEDNVQYTYDSIKGPLGTHIPTTFFDSDSVILMPDPSYGVIADEVNRCDAKVHSFPLDKNGDGFDIFISSIEQAIEDAIAKYCSERKTKIFLYLNIPHNPAGFVFNSTRWEAVLILAKEYGIMVIVDEAYTDLSFVDDSTSVLEVKGWQDNCIVLQSVSKAHGATGVRFGYILAHPIAIDVLRKVIDKKNSGAFGPSIIIGLECLADFEGAENTRIFYKKLHEQLAEALSNAGFPAGVPQGGLCQLTDFPKSARVKTWPAREQDVEIVEFKQSSDFASWLRNELRISVMAQNAIEKIRWAVTFRPQPEYGLDTEEAVLTEVGRRLDQYVFEF